MDKIALGKRDKKRPKLFGDAVWKYQIVLRKHEYYHNTCNKSFINRILAKYYHYRHHKLGLLLGFDIPINVFGGGLRINHHGYIVVSKYAKIGKYCNIHQGVNIGQQGPNKEDCPTIGDNVFISPGAKLFGRISIGDNNQIGANAVVNKSFKESGISIAGVPAKIISRKANPYVICDDADRAPTGKDA